jgi:GT2 family glycosyltransferase
MPRNGGFSYGNNAALREILSASHPPDFVYLVNPDAIARPGAVKKLADYMATNPSIAVAGGAILDTNNQQQVAARRFPSIWSELESAARLGPLSRLLRNKAVPLPIARIPHSCDWVSGASMMIATRAIRDIGLFDENYFLYFEEVDLCFRARRAGYSVHHVPDSVVIHIEGASTEIQKRQRRGAYWYNSRRRYLAKTLGITGLVLADTLWAIGRLTFKLRKLARLTKGSAVQDRDPTHFAYDLLKGDFIALVTGRILRERREAGTHP